jgi:hypothetical protein
LTSVCIPLSGKIFAGKNFQRLVGGSVSIFSPAKKSSRGEDSATGECGASFQQTRTNLLRHKCRRSSHTGAAVSRLKAARSCGAPHFDDTSDRDPGGDRASSAGIAGHLEHSSNTANLILSRNFLIWIKDSLECAISNNAAYDRCAPMMT